MEALNASLYRVVLIVSLMLAGVFFEEYRWPVWILAACVGISTLLWSVFVYFGTAAERRRTEAHLARYPDA